MGSSVAGAGAAVAGGSGACVVAGKALVAARCGVSGRQEVPAESLLHAGAASASGSGRRVSAGAGEACGRGAPGVGYGHAEAAGDVPRVQHASSCSSSASSSTARSSALGGADARRGCQRVRGVVRRKHVKRVAPRARTGSGAAHTRRLLPRAASSLRKCFWACDATCDTSRQGVSTRWHAPARWAGSGHEMQPARDTPPAARKTNQRAHACAAPAPRALVARPGGRAPEPVCGRREGPRVQAWPTGRAARAPGRAETARALAQSTAAAVRASSLQSGASAPERKQSACQALLPTSGCSRAPRVAADCARRRGAHRAWRRRRRARARRASRCWARRAARGSQTAQPSTCAAAAQSRCQPRAAWWAWRPCCLAWAEDGGEVCRRCHGGGGPTHSQASPTRNFAWLKQTRVGPYRISRWTSRTRQDRCTPPMLARATWVQPRCPKSTMLPDLARLLPTRFVSHNVVERLGLG